ncbi:hypothetical protein Z043_126194, partial [Scleropages formosus]
EIPFAGTGEKGAENQCSQFTEKPSCDVRKDMGGAQATSLCNFSTAFSRRHLLAHSRAQDSVRRLTTFGITMDSFANDSKCEVANKSLYMNYSWIIILELILGLPLNFTALYTFIFRLSIAFMTIITTDRYLSMVHPKRKNILKVMLKCSEGYRPNKDFIDILWEMMFFTKILVPFFILMFCTGRIKKTVGEQDKLRRAVFAVTAVVVVYSICFLPHAASRIVLLVERSSEDPKDLETAAEVYEGIFSFSQIDCLLDTLVYCFYSSKFKNAYLSTFFPCFQTKYNKHN